MFVCQDMDYRIQLNFLIFVGKYLNHMKRVLCWRAVIAWHPYHLEYHINIKFFERMIRDERKE